MQPGASCYGFRVLKMSNRTSRLAVTLVIAALLMNGCSVLAVADAAATVVATTVKVGANVVGAVSDAARAGVKAVTIANDEKK